MRGAALKRLLPLLQIEAASVGAAASIGPARKIWEETPTHKRTTYTYNGLDEVLTATDPLSHVTTTVYDTSGRKTSVTDAASRGTTFSYNRNARWKTTDAKNGPG